jgi:hypothetical protein
MISMNINSHHDCGTACNCRVESTALKLLSDCLVLKSTRGLPKLSRQLSNQAAVYYDIHHIKLLQIAPAQ